MEKVNWKVEGMSCTNCALTVNKYLTEKGMQDVKVNFIGGDVSFEMLEASSKEELAKGIEGLGYHVETGEVSKTKNRRNYLATICKGLHFVSSSRHPLCCTCCLVYISIFDGSLCTTWFNDTGIYCGDGFFGRSAMHSLWKGIPNMNVLIALGAVAAFGYSLYGTIIGDAAHYLFYETAATIITLVFLGNWLEDKSVETTQEALKN